MEITKARRFKPKAKKIKGNNYRDIFSNCPHCFSTLKVNNLGNWECTSGKLQLWVKEFKKYNSLNLTEKELYEQSLSNKDWFLSMYNKWSKGNLTCDYSNKVSIPNVVFKQEILDPMFVGKIERSLGRELTEEEKAGELSLYQIGEQFSTEFEEGSSIVEIPTINFPEDC